jgi:hypothetical protein
VVFFEAIFQPNALYMRQIIGAYRGLFKSRDRALNHSIKPAQIDAHGCHPL